MTNVRFKLRQRLVFILKKSPLFRANTYFSVGIRPGAGVESGGVKIEGRYADIGGGKVQEFTRVLERVSHKFGTEPRQR